MIAKAIDKIKDLTLKTTERRDIEIGGKKFIQSMGETFSDKPNLAHELEFSTLSALADYIKSGLDATLEKSIVRVLTPTKVCLEGQVFSPYALRQTVAVVEPMLPNTFPFGRFLDGESFIVSLQSMFVQGVGDWNKVVEACAGIKRDEGMSYKDDGVSQTVAARKGVSLTTTKPLPNPVIISPYRTFPEIDQPMSKFVLRVSYKRGDPELALYEADGGAWKLEAMRLIKEW